MQSDHPTDSVPDPELEEIIALAPEMAEAILAIVDQRGEWHRGLIAVAEKLRAIGDISHE